MAWTLAPLATADGTLRARIVDAHLMFDADVMVPIRQGQVDFNDATVEHVGPDSRLGVSTTGLYLDAANGRSDLYRFPTTPVAGVEVEQRAALLAPWVSDRGKLRLQEFLQGLLQQGAGPAGTGLTGPSRQMLDRASVSGDMQLGDGTLAVPGLRAELVGRAEGRNAVRIRSDAVGRGLAIELLSLSLRNVVLDATGGQVACDEVTGALTLRLRFDNGQLQVGADLAQVRMSGLRVHGRRDDDA